MTAVDRAGARYVVGVPLDPLSTPGLTRITRRGGYGRGVDTLLSPRDAGLPAALLALAVVELVSLGLADTAALPFAVVTSTLLVARRRWPWAIGTLTCVVMAMLPWFGPELDDPATPILVVGVATYTMGRRLPDLRGAASVALLLGLLVVDLQFTTKDKFDVSDVVFLAVMTLPPYAAGRVMRALAARNERLREQAAELLRLQDQVRVEAAAAERGRIARELHDVIAHSVSAMVVQASAAEELMAGDPVRARAAVREVATTGRRALAETGRLLHLLRDSGDELGLAPDVGLGRLTELVDGFRRDGLDVSLDVSGSVADLPAGVDLSAYRVVQESLTNALKHGDATVRVDIARNAERLRIEVVNPMSPTSVRPGGSGLGLVGMGERVSVFGGSLSHGVVDGAWCLVAELPLAVDG